MENVALFLHLLGALAFVAGIVVAGVAFEAARRQRLAADVALLLGLTRFGVALVGIGGTMLLACGFWLASLEKISLGSGWLRAAITLFFAALALGGVAGQRPKQARRVAVRLAKQGDEVDPELRRLLDDRASLIANYASAALVLAVLALMVFKP
ncbi:MAG TPA: DUF2269 family protein [Solirubrobacterales bacterium]|nr:DUF2269 family protein [Solirubrobacterales bacterium]